MDGRTERVSRFIPARAGNSFFPQFFIALVTVYPRSRGELKLEKPEIEDPTGLSPLARGTRVVVFKRDGGGRFIPARAGNSTSENRKTLFLSVYPRSRGELDLGE